MFTGLVQAVGEVREARETPAGVRLSVEAPGWSHDAAEGDSISVAGACLTVAEPPGGPAGVLRFDVVRETLDRTTLGGLAAGSRVNLETSATASTLLGGHIVQGHVDGVGVVERVRADPEDWRVRIEAPADLLDFVVPKGSITIEGVSLTIASVEGGSFEVALIPTTLAKTTLGELREGGPCNLESDVLARTVVHYLRRAGAGRG